MNLFHLRKKNSMHRQKGQMLVIVLCLLLLALTIVSSSLAFVGTSIKTNKTYNTNTISMYAAEAGIQDAIWNILNQADLNDIPNLQSVNVDSQENVTGPTTPQIPYKPYDYNTTWSYPLADPNDPSNQNYMINGYPISPQIQNQWVPMVDTNDLSWIPTAGDTLPPDGTITPPTPDQANAITNKSPGTDLRITGGVDNAPYYKVTVNYSSPVNNYPLYINSIGVWLPQGFSYVNGSSNLGVMFTSEQVVKCAGNEAVIWTFTNKQFSELTGGSNSTPLQITFQYDTSLQKIPIALAWMTVNPNGDFPYSYTWQADTSTCRVLSGAGNTVIEANLPKASTRAIGAAVSGDYVSIGNTLDTMNPANDHGVRTNPVVYPNVTAATSTTIPLDSNVQGAFLYWAGWFDQNNMLSLNASHGLNINFSINGNQVYFDNNGNPQRGPNPISPSRDPQLKACTIGGTFYSCYKDVTDLVRWELAKENPSAANIPGNATYSFGPASGTSIADSNDTNTGGIEAAYAGWSLIIIYSGSTTLGHQLYLYDTFTNAWGNTGNNYNGSDVDITGNTPGPGGLISGFLVPSQSPGEVEAAKLTFFVGEGDFCYSGDFLALNAPQQYWASPWDIPDGNPSKLWDGIYVAAPGSGINYPGEPHLENSITHPDNVWNGYDQTNPGNLSKFGIDLKTFHINWASGLIHSVDTSARIDIPTQIDGFNIIYTILSFRSSVTTGGSISFLIRRKQ